MKRYLRNRLQSVLRINYEYPGTFDACANSVPGRFSPPPARPGYEVNMAYIIMYCQDSCFTRSKSVSKQIICLCTSSEENLFTWKMSSSLVLYIVSEFRFFKKKMKKNTDNLRKSCFPVFRKSQNLLVVHLDVLRKHTELKQLKFPYVWL